MLCTLAEEVHLGCTPHTASGNHGCVITCCERLSCLLLYHVATVLRIWSIFPLTRLADTPLLQAMGTLTSFLTTVSTTALIALKIVLVTRRSHMHHSYSKVLEILIESSALASIVTFSGAVLLLLSVVHPFRVYKSSGRLLLQVSGLFDCLLIPAVVCKPYNHIYHQP